MATVRVILEGFCQPKQKIRNYSTSSPRLLAKKMRLGLIKIGIAVPSPDKRKNGERELGFFFVGGRVRLHVDIVLSPKC